MFSKTDASQPVVRLFFLFIILLLIILNFFNQGPCFVNSARILKAHRIQSIGQEFLPLVFYLRGSPTVGYMTCLNSSHPLTDIAIMGPYQQAQFVLNPTILDNIHPIDHRFLILYCPEGETLDQGEFTSYMILKSVKDFSLLYRKPGP